MEKRPYAIVPCTEGPIGYRIKRYRQRADALKAVAEELLGDPERHTLLRIATTYEAMADEAAHAH